MLVMFDCLCWFCVVLRLLCGLWGKYGWFIYMEIMQSKHVKTRNRVFLKKPVFFWATQEKEGKRICRYIWIYCIILHLSQFLDTKKKKHLPLLCRGAIFSRQLQHAHLALHVNPESHPATGWWYTYPSEKYESQLGWWHSQYMESHKSHVPNHQPGHSRPLLGSENGDIHPYWRDDHPLFTVTNQPKNLKCSY